MPTTELLDTPTTTDSCPQRTQSVVPTQALVLMNDEFMEDQAAFLAQRAAPRDGEPFAPANNTHVRARDVAIPQPRRGCKAVVFVQARERVHTEKAGAAARLRALTELADVLL